jgi:hypothetical protein
MIWIAIAALVIIFLAFSFLKPARPKGQYEKAEFLSPAEKSFLRLLESSVASKYRIFAKVRLADIIAPTSGDKSSWQTRFNRIAAKHVDFLLCGLTDSEPVCAIELDDRTHLAANRVERDDFLNHALQSAGIPIARFQAGRTYSGVEIEANIDSVTSKAPKAGMPPACPQCGKPMVLRTAHTGSHAGHQFWGCTGYPSCKGIVNIK